ncbi:phosphomannomutase [Alginatibacterium sediminis]|uniref:phosphomannomutase n=1 Tax=Alginatibacterium sediminis TaxID=2164068 RepID=A0A420E633_9ALTE|nr:phosphomannomutase [Alginatibacterium sediminis]RKF13254.1 phosphomannomutase [Alginatibacterium sediminis]
MNICNTDAFKSYDIRGTLPTQINEVFAYRLGRACALFLSASRMAVGYDARLSSPSLAQALMEGLVDGGVKVLDLGLVGTEEIYFASAFLKLDAAIMVTASHNPAHYNGMKLVGKKSKPISGDNGLESIRKLVALADFPKPSGIDYSQSITTFNISDPYTTCILGFIEVKHCKPLKIVVNAGNGVAGHMLDALAKYLPFTFIRIHFEPDGHFPNGIPNPLLPDRRQSTKDAVIEHQADLGIAWDGDADRCFLFDEQGRFVDAYYVVGLLAEVFLQLEPGACIIHESRCSWLAQDLAQRYKGKALSSPAGHALIKQKMRQFDAIYGGELSAHHYFRDFNYCDSGMIPWLLVAQLINTRDLSMSKLVESYQQQLVISGEINMQLNNAELATLAVYEFYAGQFESDDNSDGLSLEFKDWRFNLRQSASEPLLRLNIESRLSQAFVSEKTLEIQRILKPFM